MDPTSHTGGKHVNPGLEDLSGDSVFFKDDAGRIFHTYSTYGRGGEEFLGVYRYLDVTPKGRCEDGPTTVSPTGCGRRTCMTKAAW